MPRAGCSCPAAGAFPTLYMRDDTYVKLGVSSAVNFNFNDTAWYGRPDVLLQGNPLVNGAPGTGAFAEGSAFVDLGMYGITPVAESLYVYGGASYLTSGSVGQDLFEDRDRVYGAWEDAYARAHRRLHDRDAATGSCSTSAAAARSSRSATASSSVRPPGTAATAR
jgi:hypothetical protein